MKQLLSMLAIVVTTMAIAQDFQGVAVYQSKTSLTITTSGDGPPMDEALKEQLAKLTEKTYNLTFNKTESVYEEEATLKNPSLSVGDININMGGGKLYKNLREKNFSREMDMMGKEFLIQDSLQKPQWVLVNETRQIGDYTCYKATYTITPKPLTKEEEEEDKEGIFAGLGERKEVVVTAWYTPQIPVSHGPGDYWGLPGLILEVNSGGTTVLCSKIIINPKEKVEIKKPKKGEKVSQAGFDEIMKKKMKEMEEMYKPAKNANGGNVTTIRIGG